MFAIRVLTLEVKRDCKATSSRANAAALELDEVPKLSTVVVRELTLSFVISKLAFNLVSVPVAVSTVDRVAISDASAAALEFAELANASKLDLTKLTLDSAEATLS